MGLILKQKGFYFAFEGDYESRNAVKDILSVRFPEAERVESYVKGHWDGIIRFYKNKQFKYTLLAFVVEKLFEKGINFDIKLDNYFDDYSINPVFNKVDIRSEFLPQERFYQLNAIKQFFGCNWGVLKIPTRSGKTFVASEILRLLQYKYGHSARFLFIAESSSVFEQNSAEILNFIGENKKEALFLKGQTKINYEKDYKIAFFMFQTLKLRLTKKSTPKKLKKFIIDYIKNVDFIVIDEIHEFKSRDKVDFLKRLFFEKRKLPPKYGLFLSATPFPNDYISRVSLMEFTGPIFYEVTEKMLRGTILSQDKLLLLYTGKRYNPSGSKDIYGELNEMFIDKNKIDCLEIILNEIKKEGLITIVFFKSVKFGDNISKRFNIPFINGSTSSKDRETAKQNLLSGENSILFVSDIWKKGVTLPEVEVFINFDHGVDQNHAIQKRGRVLGATKDKTRTLSIDFADQGYYLTDHTNSRIRAYRKVLDKSNIKSIKFNKTSTKFLSLLKNELSWISNG